MGSHIRKLENMNMAYKVEHDLLPLSNKLKSKESKQKKIMPIGKESNTTV